MYPCIHRVKGTSINLPLIILMKTERYIKVRFTDNEFNDLDDHRQKLRTTFQAVGAGLFRSWLGGNATTVEPSAHRQPQTTPVPSVTERLMAIEASGDTKAIAAAHAVLNVLAQLVEKAETTIGERITESAALTAQIRDTAERTDRALQDRDARLRRREGDSREADKSDSGGSKKRRPA